jgi:hypothetical protein
MKTLRAEISSTNRYLAPLMSARYEKSITTVTHQELQSRYSKNLAKAYALLYKILTSKDIQQDTQIFSVKSEACAFKRFYGPQICKGTNGLVLLMGSETIDLEFTKGGLKNLHIPEGMDVAMKVAEEEYGGFKDIILKISVYIEAQELTIVFPIGLRLVVSEAEDGTKVTPDLDTVETLFTRSPGKFAELIADVPNVNDFDGPLLKLKQLKEGETYEVFGYRAVKPAGRLTFILSIRPTEQGQTYTDDSDPDLENEFEQAEVWANSSLKTALLSEPKIDDENPAQLLIRSVRANKSGTTTVDCALIVKVQSAIAEDEIDFDF